jgi:drug/metabolite transporter (DMT)-like permease
MLLFVFLRLTGGSLQLPKSRRRLLLLLVSGVCLTLNWAFLFEAYRLTTLATAELAYEMAPVMVIAVSPFLLNERITRTRLVCLCLALVGIVCVSGVLEPGAAVGVTLQGVGLGLVAACFYASVMVLSQFMGEVDPYTKTIVQLGVAGLALLPQVMLAGVAPWAALGLREVALLAIVCLVHTGLAFILWFSSLHELPAQKVAVFNYIDPAVALLSSALVLGEHMTLLATIGAVLILGSTLASELLDSRT